MFRNTDLKEVETDCKRERKETLSGMAKQVCKTVQLEQLFPEMEGRKGRRSRRGKGRGKGKGKSGDHMLWKFNMKQALRFPENMGIELNTREEFSP